MPGSLLDPVIRGHGAPNILVRANEGTIYVDEDTGATYVNTDGAYGWQLGGAGSGITELTSEVTAGPGTGAQAATVRATHSGSAHHALSHDHSGTPAKLAQANSHESPDTDAGTTSLHHTLGTGANQAAGGTHTHAATGATRAFAFFMG